MELLGRKKEIAIFDDAMRSSKSEMIALIGRRRVGKTFLIRKYFADSIMFEFVGIYKGTLVEHTDRFNKACKQYFKNPESVSASSNWFQIFDELEMQISKLRTKKKKVIFLDELPWMAGSSSAFIKAISHFWNAWASRREDIILVVTGSATAWMHKKIFNNKGGLYNRTTRAIDLQPFSLQETEQFLRSKNVNLNRSAITDIYMCLGGIPYYLELIMPGESTAQIINRLFFESTAALKNEFDELFNSLFEDLETYKNCIAMLAQYNYGLTRTELLQKLNRDSGGNFTAMLHNLELSKFIIAQPQMGNKNKEKKYKLSDNFCLFYLKFVSQKPQGTWQNIYESNAWQSWSGLAFENICMQHKYQILKKLKLDGIRTNIQSWYHKGNDDMRGAQVDMLIDRADKIINLCEIKYYNQQVIVNADFEKEIRNRIASFGYFTKTRKSLFFCLISPFGASNNMLASNLIQNEVVLEDLFD